MKITQADTPTIQIDCHPMLTNWCRNLCHPTIFVPDALPGTTPPPIYPFSRRATNMRLAYPVTWSHIRWFQCRTGILTNFCHLWKTVLYKTCMIFLLSNFEDTRWRTVTILKIKNRDISTTDGLFIVIVKTFTMWKYGAVVTNHTSSSCILYCKMEMEEYCHWIRELIVNDPCHWQHFYCIVCSIFKQKPNWHTHTSIVGPLDFVRDYPGELIPEPVWILLKQETVSGSGINCKSAPRPREIIMPAPHHSIFLQAGCPSCCPTNSVEALKAEKRN